jgi:hypothetical protein
MRLAFNRAPMARRVGLALLFVVVAAAGARADTPDYDFAVDVDGTLIGSSAPWLEESRPGRIVEAEDWGYLLGHGAEEFLQFLSRHGRVSIFSRRSEEFSSEIINAIRMPDGSRSRNRVHQILSGGADGKDLLRIAGARLDRALLIDDEEAHAMQGQKPNLVLVRSGLEVERDEEYALRSFPESRSAAWIADYAAGEFASRNRLVAAAGIIATAFDKMALCPGLTLPAAVRQVQRVDDMGRAHQERAIYERGLAALRLENPNFDLQRFDSGREALSPASHAALRAAERQFGPHGTIGGLATEVVPRRRAPAARR